MQDEAVFFLIALHRPIKSSVSPRSELEVRLVMRVPGYTMDREIAEKSLPSTMGTRCLNEVELIHRCREGNREAQRALFEQTSGPVYRLLLRLSGDPDDAFDLTQETYVKAFSAIARFDGRSSLKTWLTRISVNEALQHHRRSQSFQRKLERMTQGWTEESETTSGTACRIDVNQALSQLDPAERAILLLRYHEGLDYDAISHATGVSAGTVGSRLNRARQRLKAMLNGGYGREEIAAPVHLMNRQEHELT